VTEERQSGRLSETNRVEAFSDGVFAIALTLLVLDLKVPEERGSFPSALADQWPAYLAYLAAFLNIASIWINHHDLFTRVRRVDIKLVCANLLLLLVTSLFPWPAAVVSAAIRHGDHHDQVVAAGLYAVIGIFVPVAWILVYAHLERHPHLLEDAADVQYVRRGARLSTVPLVVYPAAVVVALWQPVIAVVAFVVVPAIFIASLLLPVQDAEP
jgi:uncharacterized membrane protein